MKKNNRKKQFNTLCELSNYLMSKNVMTTEGLRTFDTDFFDGSMLRDNANKVDGGVEVSISDALGENIEYFSIPFEENNSENLSFDNWFLTLGSEESLNYSVIR